MVALREQNENVLLVPIRVTAGHTFKWHDGGSGDIPLFKLPDWCRDLCVLEDPALNHDSL